MSYTVDPRTNDIYRYYTTHSSGKVSFVCPVCDKLTSVTSSRVDFDGQDNIVSFECTCGTVVYFEPHLWPKDVGL